MNHEYVSSVGAKRKIALVRLISDGLALVVSSLTVVNRGPFLTRVRESKTIKGYTIERSLCTALGL